MLLVFLFYRESADGGRIVVQVEDKVVRVRNVKVKVVTISYTVAVCVLFGICNRKFKVEFRLCISVMIIFFRNRL